MLSVCIPVYNVDVRNLAKELVIQAGNLNVQVEIIFFDDASGEEFRAINRETTQLNGVILTELPVNIGRSAIRNSLAKAATQPWLLFIDADSATVNENYLQNYITTARKDAVYCGGTVYNTEKPAGKTTMLRWVYGRKREQLTAQQRNNRSHFAITANNFMIKRDTFLRFGFRETIDGYGHEDTVLGYDLKKAGISIRHIDNPVLHTGLEPSADYLEKTRKALGNLITISDSMITDPEFMLKSGILSTCKRLQKYKLAKLTGFIFKLVAPLLEKHLTGKSPQLWIFDLYRLGYVCHKKLSKF